MMHPLLGMSVHYVYGPLKMSRSTHMMHIRRRQPSRFPVADESEAFILTCIPCYALKPRRSCNSCTPCKPCRPCKTPQNCPSQRHLTQEEGLEVSRAKDQLCRPQSAGFSRVWAPLFHEGEQGFRRWLGMVHKQGLLFRFEMGGWFSSQGLGLDTAAAQHRAPDGRNTPC